MWNETRSVNFNLGVSDYMSDTQKKLTTGPLVLMIFTTIFGFANTPVAFQQMGYGAILWYLLGAILYFLPSSMMYAEYGSALKESRGACTRGWMRPSANGGHSSPRLFGFHHG